VGKKTKSGFSTNAETLERLVGVHPIIEHILSYRTYQKLNSTYVEGLMKAVDVTGRIHTEFKQTETRTGRISSREPNLQNIPVRTELGSRFRKYFISEKGRVLLDADYSQIELRVLASMSGDTKMIEAFTDGRDIHTETASEIFKIPRTMVTPELRRRAKAVNFGIVYGIGAFSLAQDVGVSMREAKEYIDSYLATYSGIAEYLADTVKRAQSDGYVTTLYGRRRALPELASSNKMLQALGKRLAMNTPIQGTAADIIKLAMIRVRDRLKKENLDAQLVLQVHDELIVESSYADKDRASALLHEEMEAAAELKAPLVAQVNSGESWYDAK
ncbi:MAG: DNA polymerase, partial [Oscillospiraceae bacterium]